MLSIQAPQHFSSDGDWYQTGCKLFQVRRRRRGQHEKHIQAPQVNISAQMVIDIRLAANCFRSEEGEGSSRPFDTDAGEQEEHNVRQQILQASLPFVHQHGWTKKAISAGKKFKMLLISWINKQWEVIALEQLTSHIERRPTTTETQVAYDNFTWHAVNTRYRNSTKETSLCW